MNTDITTWLQLAALAVVVAFLFFKRMRSTAWMLLAAVQAFNLYLNGITLLGIAVVLCLVLAAGTEIARSE